MAAGDLINYANYKAMDGGSWRHKGGTWTSAGSYTFVVSAPAFQANCWICGSGLWGYQEGGIQVYPYDESTGTFSSTAVFNKSGNVKGGSNKSEWTFNHNYNGGTSGDIHDCQIWKVTFYLGNNDGTKGCWLYTGGLGLVPESIYNSHFKGRLVYASKGDYWQIKSSGTTYASIEACLNAEGYSHMRGTPVSVSTGTYKYITSKPL